MLAPHAHITLKVMDMENNKFTPKELHTSFTSNYEIFKIQNYHTFKLN